MNAKRIGLVLATAMLLLLAWWATTRNAALSTGAAATSNEASGQEGDVAASERMMPQARGLWAQAHDFEAPVYGSINARRGVIGVVRRGKVLPVRRNMGSHCPGGGEWFELRTEGYVCSTSGFEIGSGPLPPSTFTERDASATLPHPYARVRSQGALRANRVPTPDELQHLNASSFVEEITGTYFVAVDERVHVGNRAFVRSVAGDVFDASDLEFLEPPALRGELLDDENRRLPLAFVFGGDATRWCPSGDSFIACGVVAKHERIYVRQDARVNDEALVVGDDFALERQRVRLVTTISRPEGVPGDAQWLHIDIAEQALVAYEGDLPVFATIVSTGREGFSTPPGLYRTTRKLLTRTMGGTDPVDGRYRVEEVPWVLYYHRGYAIHGTYWHDAFGEVRSHGCTNLSPYDARWIFDWSGHALPPSWHGVNRGPGMWIYLSD